MHPDEKRALLFLLQHMVYGLTGATVFGVGALVIDLGGIWSMARSSPDGWLFIFLFFFGLFVTFGSIGMGAGVMLMKRDRDDE